MAILIPEVPKDCSQSERGVFERLGRDLPDDWIVLHSLGLHGHETKIWGEADIVVLSTAGIFALEVKGGAVSCQDGVWRYGSGVRSYTKKEDPWTQSKDTMMAIRDHLRQADRQFHDVLFGFGVVMPMTTFTTGGLEILPEVLLDRRQYKDSLKTYLRRLEHHWQASYADKHERAYGGLTIAQIRRARQILRPDLEAALSLGSYLTGIESRLLQLTNEQIRASRRMAANPRTIVRGPAGTGKSILALERARQLSEAGHRVLFLCFNQLLAAHVRQILAGDQRARGVEVHHAHGLYHHIIEQAGLSPRLQSLDVADPGYFARAIPDLAMEGLCIVEDPPWDALIVDEAQDLLTTEHLDVFDLLVRDGLRRGRWHLFLDPRQNLYGSDVQEQVEGRLEELYPAFEDLNENCRNTQPIAVHASMISSIELATTGAPEGPPCEILFHADREEFLRQIEEIVGNLLARDVRIQDIIILSTRKWDNSMLAGVTQLAGRPLAAIQDEAGLKNGAIAVSTMHAFKGLERQVVIAIDMAEIGEAHWLMLHYAGLSRASGLLHVLMPASAKRKYEAQAEAYGRRIASEA